MIYKKKKKKKKLKYNEDLKIRENLIKYIYIDYIYNKVN